MRQTNKIVHSWREGIALAILPGTILLLLHGLFILIGLYDWNVMPWFDIPMHILGGITVGWGIWSIIQICIAQKKIPRLPVWLIAIAVIGTAAIVGILWEMYEFVYDRMCHTVLQASLSDTMKDLMDDLIGSVLFALAVVRKK